MSLRRTLYYEKLDRDSKRRAEWEGKVVRFLREHPLSTADEVFKATGCGVVGNRWITWTRYKGEVVWRLNHPKLKAAGLE